MCMYVYEGRQASRQEEGEEGAGSRTHNTQPTVVPCAGQDRCRRRGVRSPPRAASPPTHHHHNHSASSTFHPSSALTTPLDPRLVERDAARTHETLFCRSPGALLLLSLPRRPRPLPPPTQHTCRLAASAPPVPAPPRYHHTTCVASVPPRATEPQTPQLPSSS